MTATIDCGADAKKCKKEIRCFDARVAYGIESMLPPNLYVAFTEKNEQMTQRNEFWFNFGLFSSLFIALQPHTLS